MIFQEMGRVRTQHYSTQLISNAIMYRLQSTVSYEFHYCRVLTVLLGAGEAHACTMSAHAHSMLYIVCCMYLYNQGLKNFFLNSSMEEVHLHR